MEKACNDNNNVIVIDEKGRGTWKGVSGVVKKKTQKADVYMDRQKSDGRRYE